MKSAMLRMGAIIFFNCLLVFGPAVWAQNSQTPVVEAPLSAEELAIIKNLDLLENLEIFKDGQEKLLENYDEVSSLNTDEGGSNEN